MRKWLFLVGYLLLGFTAIGQTLRLSGVVSHATTGMQLEGVSVQLVLSKQKGMTARDGSFQLHIAQADTLVVSMVGFEEKRIPVRFENSILTISLKERMENIAEVVIQTGYYQIPKERATGSFVHLDQEALNRAMGTSILTRLEGMLEGVQFVNPNGTSPADIRVRGLSTIESDETPLIILDNFPFEGDLATIDPNTIESVTVLKDAAAASIWGARAGNGVIVITSKTAVRNQRTNVSIHMETNLKERPDFMYSRSRMLPGTVMEIEKERFESGLYAFNDGQAQTVYVDYLRRHKAGLVTDTELSDLERLLRTTDIRKQAMEYLYRTHGYQKASINLNGGNQRHAYLLNASRTWTQDQLVGNGGSRNSLGISNVFNPIPSLRLKFGLDYHTSRSESRGIGIEQLNIGGTHVLAPYLRLVDDDGKPFAIPRNGLDPLYMDRAESTGLLNWQYRPLVDRDMRASNSKGEDLRLNTDLSYTIADFVTFRGLYQYNKGSDHSYTHYMKDSYYVRDLVNTFTQADGSRIVPHNGILSIAGPTESVGHFARVQMDMSKNFWQEHRIDFLSGAEWRHSHSHQLPGSILYDYDEHYLIGSNRYNFDQTYRTKPRNVSQRVPNAASLERILTGRDISYYANAGYAIASRYFISGSIRWDGSNLFGVKTNQKGVPLWSVGAGWNLQNEPTLGLLSWFEELKIRTTYGVSGNVNKTITHMPTIRFGMDSNSGLRNATLLSVGNSSLRWEKVNTMNLGLDWSLNKSVFSGSLDYYIKHGSDLIGNDYMDPTTGITGDYKINYADIRTKGWDLRLEGRYSVLGITWKGVVASSWVRDKVTDYNTNQNISLSNYFTSTPPIIGRSRDVVYALPWNGLSSVTGLPIVYLDGEETMNYATYYQTFDPDQLLVKGSKIPTWYGSFRNSFTWRGWDLGAMVGWKAGYVYRRTSMEPFHEYDNKYHMDYYQRWEQPGDENYTVVPKALSYAERTTYNGLANYYKFSGALVSRGDHVRLQDVRLGYSLPKDLYSRWKIHSLSINLYMKNLGLIWVKNDQGVDPDFVDSEYVTPRSFSMGLRVGL